MVSKDLYQKLNSTKLGLAAGIVGAVLTFLTTITGIYGKSQAANTMTSTFWGSLGYTVSWGGAFIGLVIGFIYAFILIWIIAVIYNKFI